MEEMEGGVVGFKIEKMTSKGVEGGQCANSGFIHYDDWALSLRMLMMFYYSPEALWGDSIRNRQIMERSAT